MVGTRLQWLQGRSWILTLIGLKLIVSTSLFYRVYLTRTRTYDSVSCRSESTATGLGAHAGTGSDSTWNVLVTGAAGFIGFHVAAALSSALHNVVGVDNFNDYYDVRLKHARARELEKLGVPVHHNDVCNYSHLLDVMTSRGISHVVHLAAQAGVRHSLYDPLAYVTANIECLLVLLDILRQFPKTKLVYASSSSVYGQRSSMPFRVPWPTSSHAVSAWDAASPPANMYAATKKAGEALVDVFCRMNRQLRSPPVGLRLFTVYGPWGRPDMAVYAFADAMMRHEQLPLFHTSDDHPVARDFTYIDDVTSGVMAAMKYEPTRCGQVFNIGRGSPVVVRRMIAILEAELNVTARIVHRPLPPTEILQTFADISITSSCLNFRPTVSLRHGIRRFVKWYKEYVGNTTSVR